jgi:hypothetical protein
MFNFQIFRKNNLKHFENGKATIAWRVVLVIFYVPKVIKMSKSTDLAKTVHFGKYLLFQFSLLIV